MKVSSVGSGRFINPFSIEFNNKIEVIVGDNGSGKSSLLSAIRGEFITKKYEKGSLYDSGFIELRKHVTIEHDFEAAFFYDAVKDNPKDGNNSYDAMEYLFNGGHATKDVSHGQSSSFMLSKTITKLAEYRKGNPEAKILVILDEPEVGFDLKTQYKLPDIIRNMSQLFNCYILCVTHNYFVVSTSDTVTLCDNMTYRKVNADEYLITLISK